MFRLGIFTFIWCAAFHSGYGKIKIPPNPDNYFTRTSVSSGLVFPKEIHAVLGEETFFKIIEPVDRQTHCFYRPPGGKDQNVLSPHKNNLKALKGESCGLHIKNIGYDDAGIWRLTSTNDKQNMARGAVVIKVRDKTIEHKNQINSLNVEVMSEETAYCYVSRPDAAQGASVNDKCKFPEFQSEREANGLWDVVGGVKGKTSEVAFQVNVQAQVEDIITSIESDKKRELLNLKCALVHTKKMMKFCRFLRLNDDYGFNLEEGRGNDRYRYFGSGFKNHECGISLTKPLAVDKSPWKCFIGVEMDGMTATVGAILDASENDIDDEIDGEDVYALEDTVANILCKRKAVTDYCWFRDPSGRKISLSDRMRTTPDEMHKYYGSGIKLGECGITIMKATHNDSGTWTCHMGMTDRARVDSSKEISVRITESSLVSTSLFQDAQIGTSLSIECKSIPSHVPLDYCRFILPDGTGFSINEKSTSSNPHMQIYHFNPNRKLRMGYCSIIVSKIDRMHMGQWTCAARLSGYEYESHDEFRVIVFDNDTVAASATGMIIGVIILICSISGLAFVAWYRQRNIPRLPTLIRWPVVRFRRSDDAVSISSDNSSSTTGTALPMSSRA